ncbi:HAD family hydrolase [[Clostridium] fimetarium]|uniref:Phosphoglycolate phosphatase n=1 Tax=[Clostridium] fimetarium TaxID=99656 RepID=A0A1I0P1E4_9FIRM|nr:HAD hydrolase-like protein [[Clostridium] fimetarium]SEW07797.1 phosphoglycolate phosphatase [[Clostridium] fimetarium]
MDKNYEIAVFDVDGTLLDTTEGVLAAVKYTIEKHGLEQITDEQLLTFIGPPMQDSFAKVYGIDGELVQELTTTFRNRYKDYELFKAKPYDGIYEVFDELQKKGVKLAVATYKRQDYAEAILKHFGFDKYTNILYGADHQNKLKKVDIIEKCMNDLGVTDYSNAVMIGDSGHDANGAKLIGMDFIGVTYGFDFRTSEDVAKYPCAGCAHTTLELLKFFK